MQVGTWRCCTACFYVHCVLVPAWCFLVKIFIAHLLLFHLNSNRRATFLLPAPSTVPGRTQACRKRLLNEWHFSCDPGRLHDLGQGRGRRWGWRGNRPCSFLGSKSAPSSPPLECSRAVTGVMALWPPTMVAQHLQGSPDAWAWQAGCDAPPLLSPSAESHSTAPTGASVSRSLLMTFSLPGKFPSHTHLAGKHPPDLWRLWSLLGEALLPSRGGNDHSRPLPCTLPVFFPYTSVLYYSTVLRYTTVFPTRLGATSEQGLTFWSLAKGANEHARILPENDFQEETTTWY